MREKIKAILAEHGPIAVVVYFAIFFLVWGGFTAAISAGFRPEGAAEGAGVFTMSYFATKVTQPLRIGATLVLTPLVTRAWRRLRRKPAGNPPPPS